MYTAPYRVSSQSLASGQAAAKLSQALYGFAAHSEPCSLAATHGINVKHAVASFSIAHRQNPATRRHFSSTPRAPLKEYFSPAKDAPSIRVTGPAWPHPVYNEKDMTSIAVAHREAKTVSDKIALTLVKILRTGLDLTTGYRHDKEVAKGTKDPKKANQPRRFAMTERKWIIRCVFLESVAGVPGMVAGTLRHLRSLRRMKRDNGWIESLLEEAYNERMHLLTFLKIAEPGWFMRFMVLGAQGVFYNAFFLGYLISPKTAHRFVGYLEEEAVLTYTRAIADIEAGKLPKWENMQAPDIAVRYWDMPEGKRMMKDLLWYIRADEAKHREVNHTLGNLDQANDPNPFVSDYYDPNKPHPGKGIEHCKPTGWDREEVL